MLAGTGSTGLGAGNQGLDHVLDQWTVAMVFERLLPLFADNVEYEDVTFGTDE
jgi:hypothetical protein